MNVSQCTTELCNPESDSLFRERFPGYVEPDIATIHQINDDVPAGVLGDSDSSIHVMYTACRHADSQVFHILEAVPQITQKRVIEVLQHPPLPYDIPHTFRAHHLIFPDVFEGKGEARIFALHNPDLAKRSFADDAQEAKVVEIDLIGQNDGLAIGVAHLRSGAGMMAAGEPKED